MYVLASSASTPRQTVDKKTVDNNKTSSRRRRRRARERRVAFDRNVRVMPTIHINDYTDEEVFACWNTQEEVANAREEIWEEIEAIELGELEMQRGLEGHTELGSRERRLATRTAVFVVLDELEWQQGGGCINHEIIAELYREACKQSRKDARAIGKADVKAAQYSFKQKHVDPMDALRARRYIAALGSKY